MGRWGLAGRVAAAFLLDLLVLTWFPLWGVRPRLLRRQGATIDDAMDLAGLPLLGLVPEDARVVLAASSGQLLSQQTRRGAARAYGNIARRLMGQQVPLMRIY